MSTARENRALLANAHAGFFAHSNLPNGNKLMELLKQLKMIEQEDDFLHIHKDGTTIVVVLKLGETLELDSYGNIMRAFE